MEDLKQMWQQYDEKLQRTQAFNEELLRKMATRHSTDRIGKLRNIEYVGMFVLGILLVILVSRIGTVGSYKIVQVSYALVLAQIVGWTLWTCRKLTFLSKLDMSKLPVTEMLRRMSHYRIMVMRERLWGGLSALLLLLIPANIVADYWVSGDVPVLDHPVRYVLRTLPAVGIGIAAGLWAYRKFYKDPIREITESLREIEEFDKS